MRWWLASIADEFLCWLVFCPADNSVSCWQLKDNFLSPLPVFRILTNNDSTAHVTEWPSVTWGHHHCHLTPASWQHHTCHIVTSVTSPANAGSDTDPTDQSRTSAIIIDCVTLSVTYNVTCITCWQDHSNLGVFWCSIRVSTYFMSPKLSGTSQIDRGMKILWSNSKCDFEVLVGGKLFSTIIQFS